MISLVIKASVSLDLPIKLCWKMTPMRPVQQIGVGLAIKEVPNLRPTAGNEPLQAGMVVTIESIISSGSGRVVVDSDGWTIKTADGSISAHYEHTVVITRSHPILLTAVNR